jgi:hypothetical protein
MAHKSEEQDQVDQSQKQRAIEEANLKDYISKACPKCMKFPCGCPGGGGSEENDPAEANASTAEEHHDWGVKDPVLLDFPKTQSLFPRPEFRMKKEKHSEDESEEESEDEQEHIQFDGPR